MTPRTFRPHRDHSPSLPAWLFAVAVLGAGLGLWLAVIVRAVG